VRAARERLAIDQGPVGALEVLDEKVVLLRTDPAMATRDPLVLQRELDCRITPQGDGAAHDHVSADVPIRTLQDDQGGLLALRARDRLADVVHVQLEGVS